MCRKKERKEELVNGKKGESRERVCVCVCVWGTTDRCIDTGTHTQAPTTRSLVVVLGSFATQRAVTLFSPTSTNFVDK